MSDASSLQLCRPSMALLDQYVEALNQGFSTDNRHPVERTHAELAAIDKDAPGFIAKIDGSRVAAERAAYLQGHSTRLPGYRRWLFHAGQFVGSFGFRWVPGSPELPDTVPGHIGYAISAHQRNRGFARAGLALLLEEIRTTEALPFVELSIEHHNLPSIKVALANQARLHSVIEQSPFYPESIEHRYRLWFNA